MLTRAERQRLALLLEDLGAADAPDGVASAADESRDAANTERAVTAALALDDMREKLRAVDRRLARFSAAAGTGNESYQVRSGSADVEAQCMYHTSRCHGQKKEKGGRGINHVSVRKFRISPLFRGDA